MCTIGNMTSGRPLTDLFGMTPLKLASTLDKYGKAWEAAMPTRIPAGYTSCTHQSEYALTHLYRGLPRAEMNITNPGPSVIHAVPVVLLESAIMVSEHEFVVTHLFQEDPKAFGMRGSHCLVPFEKYIYLFMSRWVPDATGEFAVSLCGVKDRDFISRQFQSGLDLLV